MKKIFIPLLLFILGTLPIQALAGASSPPPIFGSIGAILTAVCKIFDWMFAGAVLLTVFYTLWAGIQYMNSKGKEQGIKEINKSLEYIAYGFVIVLIAKGVPAIIGSIFTTSVGSVC